MKTGHVRLIRLLSFPPNTLFTISNLYTAIIFGGGLAGSILAERFLSVGKRALLVDDPSKSRCSRVAAGLINPIGGKRLKLVWMANTLIPHAKAYYDNLERLHHRSLYHPLPIVRHFASEDERHLWHTKRAGNPLYQAHTAPLSRDQADSPPDKDGFLIPDAGYLNTNALLELLHSELLDHDSLLSSAFNYKEVNVTENGTTFRNYDADYAIFAEGHLATGNPYFKFIPYKPAKGIIASIKLSSKAQARVSKNHIFLKQKFILPRHDGVVIVGATYNWNDPTDTPDEAGIQELEQFLDAELGKGNWSFHEILAGVRPATAGAYPVIGQHPDQPRLIAFNGFGSKGSLQIPYFADALVASLFPQDRTNSKHRLPREALPSRFFKKSGPQTKRWIATDVAREAATRHLHPGDAAVDATAGNGHDSQWLAEAVGPTGHVFAIDLQSEAIEATRQRLRSQDRLPRVTLLNANHVDLLKIVPTRFHAQIAVIVFNLGYLPGGDKSLTTRPNSTLVALKASLDLLKPGGALSVVLYPAHPGGRQEADAVEAWANQLEPQTFEVNILSHPNDNPASPYPLIVRKRPAPTNH